MKTRLLTLLAAIVAICFAESLQAQMLPSAGMMPPNMGQAYGQPAAYLPVPQGYGQQPYVMQGMAPHGFAPAMAPQGFAPSMGAPASFIPASPALAPPSQVLPAGATHGGKGGGKGCQSCGGKGGKCCSPLGWEPGWAFYGDFLYWRARDSEVAWGVEINSNAQNPPIQVSPIAVADMDHQPGWRAGFSKILDECTRINAEYTMWEAGSNDAIQRGSIANVIDSLVDHPSTTTAASDFINGTAQYGMSLDMVDVELQRAYYYDSGMQLSWLMGVRAVTHETQFNARYFGQVNRTVNTDIDFNGVGPRVGLDAEYAISCQWLAYGSMFGSIVPGKFETTYTQSDVGFGAQIPVNTAWQADRVVTIWDLEWGVARVSKCKNYRASVGYTLSAWTNMVQTDEWIKGVQANNFVGMDSTSTLDGLVVRVEARF